MSILSQKVILREIKRGGIVIEPFSEDQIGPGSVDLQLGNIFRIFDPQRTPFKVTEEIDIAAMTRSIEIDEGDAFILQPGQTVLGVTKEKISLAPYISGWIEGRSRFARVGLAIHTTSGFIQPGTSSKQVLEMTNLSPTPLALYPGTHICQVIFERCEGEAHYEGRYQNQQYP